MGGKRKVREVRRQDIIFFLFKAPEKKVESTFIDPDPNVAKQKVKGGKVGKVEGEEDLVEDYFEQTLEEDEYYNENFGTKNWSNRIVRNHKNRKGKMNCTPFTRRKKKKKKRRGNKRMYKTRGKIQKVHMMKKEAKRQYNVLFNLANRYGCDVSDIASTDDLVQLFIEKQDSACNRNRVHENRRSQDREDRDYQKAIQNSLIVPQNQIQVNENSSSSMVGIERLLYDLQFREITPEDYEILGILDESVPKKTTSESSMERNTKIRNIQPGEVGEQCLICYDEFEESEEIRELKCEHYYHVDCIDRYLKEFSTNCPTCRVSIEEL